jgi:DNA-binding transcriptional ArsR family regulator
MSPRASAGARAAAARPPAAKGTGKKGAPLGRHAPVFAALGDKTRLQLVAVLCAGGAMSIAHLTAGTELTRQAVTKHLQILADAGLVRDVKVGRERRWKFEATRLADARRSLDAIAAQWDRALERLKTSLER